MQKKVKILVTGGAGFIGSALCRYLVNIEKYNVYILDKLTYASNINSLKSILDKENVTFIKGSIGNNELIQYIFSEYSPNYIFNLAAETHVDNSIKNPAPFIKTNISETFNFVNETLRYYKNLSNMEKTNFRFLHISTDEVFGDIGKNEDPVLDDAPYNPSSPYSASKASSDHLIKSYYRTFGLPIIISNCSNNYGPFQHSEKFIPVIINSLLNGNKIPLYGDGKQIREWLFVDDHCDALYTIIKKGEIGESYNVGSGNELSNVKLVELIIRELKKQSLIFSDVIEDHIIFVDDRPGHDRRYAINSTKLSKNLNWKPKMSFSEGIKETIKYFNANKVLEG